MTPSERRKQIEQLKKGQLPPYVESSAPRMISCGHRLHFKCYTDMTDRLMKQALAGGEFDVRFSLPIAMCIRISLKVHSLIGISS